MTLGPNAAWVREAFESWNAGDRSPPLERFDPEVEISTVIGDAFAGEPYRGHEGARAWLANLDESFETWRVIPEEWHERDDVLVVLGTVHARGRGSGIEFDQPIAWVARFRDDKLFRLQTYVDREEALAAVGLS
ncbi:MAG: nuclear transport factor 2 family protein [Solirubrobacterales bacterium]